MLANHASMLPVDVIIPAHAELPVALEATLEACEGQAYPPSKILVVDDGSPKPVTLPTWAKSKERIRLFRLPENRGISVARNAAIALSDAPLLACVNVEILPDRDWLAVCVEYLEAHPEIGACYTRLVPKNPRRLLSRWRMRFQEAKYGEISGSARFAPGHAVLFRRAAIDRVGGYAPRFRRIMEDSDICERMRKAGWETHYVAESRCVSIQSDSLAELCRKQLLRSGWNSPEDYSLGRLFKSQCKWLFMRMGRNLVKGRLVFLPVDWAVWAGALWIAISRNLRSARSHGGS